MTAAFFPTKPVPRAIVWMRRDLRLDDNVAIARAAHESASVCLAFVLDPALLTSERVGAPLVQCFFDALRALRAEVRARGSDLALLEGDVAVELPALARRIGASAVYFNEDYEPAAIARDERVERALRATGVEPHACLDHVCFGASEIETDEGAAYKVFAPYKRRWLDRYRLAPRLPVASAAALEGTLLAAAAIGQTREVPIPETYGYASSPEFPQCSEAFAREALAGFLKRGGAGDRYRELRDLPGARGTSRLSPQLRAGTVGVRTCFAKAFAAMRTHDPAAHPNLETWISELIWREFYQMVLRRYPHVADGPFLPAAQGLCWRDDEDAFAAWCEGRTGYPIVDAAMLQLNRTGWMHNRLRMIVASFLTKDLLISWQRGERYFERHLADADLAQNNGGWQWAASTGTDAAPYFRIFNPILQGRKFDPDGAFVKGMLPALAGIPSEYAHAPWELPPLLQAQYGCAIGRDYPAPIVDHAAARDRAVAAFAPVLGKKSRS